MRLAKNAAQYWHGVPAGPFRPANERYVARSFPPNSGRPRVFDPVGESNPCDFWSTLSRPTAADVGRV
jgi:hypothetical protein